MTILKPICINVCTCAISVYLEFDLCQNSCAQLCSQHANFPLIMNIHLCNYIHSSFACYVNYTTSIYALSTFACYWTVLHTCMCMCLWIILYLSHFATKVKVRLTTTWAYIIPGAYEGRPSDNTRTLNMHTSTCYCTILGLSNYMYSTVLCQPLYNTSAICTYILLLTIISLHDTLQTGPLRVGLWHYSVTQVNYGSAYHWWITVMH